MLFLIKNFLRQVTRNVLIVCSEQFKSVERVHKLFLFLPAWLARGKLTTGCYVRVPHGCHQENIQEIHQWVCEGPSRNHRLMLWAHTKDTFIKVEHVAQLLVVFSLQCVWSLACARTRLFLHLCLNLCNSKTGCLLFDFRGPRSAGWLFRIWCFGCLNETFHFSKSHRYRKEGHIVLWKQLPSHPVSSLSSLYNQRTSLECWGTCEILIFSSVALTLLSQRDCWFKTTKMHIMVFIYTHIWTT